MDPRRNDRVTVCPEKLVDNLSSGDHFNALGLVFSLLALVMRVSVYNREMLCCYLEYLECCVIALLCTNCECLADVQDCVYVL